MIGWPKIFVAKMLTCRIFGASIASLLPCTIDSNMKESPSSKLPETFPWLIVVEFCASSIISTWYTSAWRDICSPLEIWATNVWDLSLSNKETYRHKVRDIVTWTSIVDDLAKRGLNTTVASNVHWRACKTEVKCKFVRTRWTCTVLSTGRATQQRKPNECYQKPFMIESILTLSHRILRCGKFHDLVSIHITS